MSYPATIREVVQELADLRQQLALAQAERDGYREKLRGYERMATSGVWVDTPKYTAMAEALADSRRLEEQNSNQRQVIERIADQLGLPVGSEVLRIYRAISELKRIAPTSPWKAIASLREKPPEDL